MRLTNEEKYHNNSMQTGIDVLQNKILKFADKIKNKEEEILILQKIEKPKPLNLSRITVAENDIKMLKGFTKQLNKSIETLNACKFEK